MKKWNIVITDREYEDIDQEKALLEPLGAEIHDYQIRDSKELLEVVGDCDALITQYASISREVIEAMPHCQIIAKYAIGLDKIDIPAATEHSICVAHVRDYCIDEVSSHTVGMILDLTRKLSLMNADVKKGHWDHNVGKRIYNLRGLILGLNSFGKNAQAVAEKMKPFGMRMIAYDPFVSREFAAEFGVELVDVDTMLAQSDILSTHAPDVPETRGMFNREAFRKMKKSAYLINTGRGPVVDTPSLIWALEEGEIAGAGLDVLEPEPIRPDNPMIQMDNVVFTPHAAYYSEDSQRALQRFTTENVMQRLAGYCPRFLANPEVASQLDLKPLPSDWRADRR